MTILAFLYVGGCFVIAYFINSVLDKRAEKKANKQRLNSDAEA